MGNTTLRRRSSTAARIQGIALIVAAAFLICTLAHANPNLASTTELERLMARGVPVVDVRTPSEWEQTGVIEGAHLLTFFDEAGRYDWNAWFARFKEIAPKDQPVVLMCHSGVRSSAIAKALTGKAGYVAVYDYGPGIQGWLEDKRPTVRP